MHKVWSGVPTQFINDIDPYAGDGAIPAPEAVESDDDSVWQDFQETEARLNSDFADTSKDELSPKL